MALSTFSVNSITSRRMSPRIDDAALTFERAIDAIEQLREQTVVMAKFEKLGVGVFEHLDGHLGDFGVAVDEGAGPADYQKVGAGIGNAGLQNFLAFGIGERNGFAANELSNFASVGCEKISGGESGAILRGDFRQMDDEVIFAQPGFVGANERGGGAL